MLTITELFIYPIKSLGGISVAQSVVTDRGQQYDRRWMLIDENNVAITQRTLPRMALLDVHLGNDTLTIVDRGTTDSISIPLQLTHNNSFTATVWDDTIPVQTVDTNVDQWFSNLLSYKCRLVYMPDASIRKVDSTSSAPWAINNLSDDYPVMLLGHESLADLNTKLATPVPMDRFRPNIVVTGGNPYEEDLLTELSINTVAFTVVRSCTRCVLVNIDQANGTKTGEPLKTLASYRNRNNKVHFGQYLVAKGHGSIAIGQTIMV